MYYFITSIQALVAGFVGMVLAVAGGFLLLIFLITIILVSVHNL